MPKYRVTLIEHILHEVTVEAETESEARSNAEEYGISRSTKVQCDNWIETGEVEEVTA